MLGKHGGPRKSASNDSVHAAFGWKIFSFPISFLKVKASSGKVMGKPESLAIISPLTSCMKQYTVHSDQLAGHNGHLLKIHGGKVMKKTKKGESAFYASLMTRNLPEEIMTFFPKFYGIEILDGRCISCFLRNLFKSLSILLQIMSF